MFWMGIHRIDLPDRLGVDRVGEHCVNHTSSPCSHLWFCRWCSALASDVRCRHGRRRRGPVAASVEHPVASAPPSRSARVLQWGLQWRWRTSLSEPVAPTPSYSAAQQGATSLLTGWASPIRTRVKGPMGRWAHWWRDQSNILPLDLTIYFYHLFSFHYKSVYRAYFIVTVNVTPDFTRKTECISYVRQDHLHTHD
jgi:hypothetical protein